MNLKQLEIFHHFCECGSMSRTATRLGVSQPAISQQLHSLEEDCGVKLFYRDGTTYRLTNTGEAISLLTKRIFSRVAQITSLIEQAQKGQAARLRIGTTKGYACTLMPDILSQFQNKFPSVQVILSEGNSADLLTRLRKRQEDLVVVATRPYDSSMRAIPFAKAKFILVARPDHPLTRKSVVSLRDLAGEALIMREPGSGSREAVLKRLDESGVKLSVVAESENLSFILAYIERRMGISFILAQEVSRELSEGILKQINLEDGPITFQSDIVFLKGEPLTVPIRYFIKVVRKLRQSGSF
jgi:DNA-binding transcriptional LysR family regulator